MERLIFPAKPFCLQTIARKFDTNFKSSRILSDSFEKFGQIRKIFGK